MPGIPSQPAIQPETDAALTQLIQRHLSSSGIELDDEQIRQIKQEEPVFQFLNAIVEIGKRKLMRAGELDTTAVPEGTGEAEQVPLDAPAAISTVGTGISEEAFALSPPPVPTVPISPVKSSRLKLRIRNGTAGTCYCHNIQVPGRIIAVEGLEGSGLTFEHDSSCLSGMPVASSKPHEYTFKATFEHENTGEVQFAAVSLLVNPDPWSLWKEIEPDPTLPYRKDHKRSSGIEKNSIRAVAASVRGRSHANSGTFREDDFYMRHDESGVWTIVAVSDGAGSAKFSRLGSQLATEVSVEHLAVVLPRIEQELSAAILVGQADKSDESRKENEATIRRLLFTPVGEAAFQASKAIKKKAEELDVEEKSLSATLLLAAVRKWEDGLLVVSYWIGDGAAAIFNPDDASLQLLGDADSGEYSGQTRFLLSNEFGAQAWENIKQRFRCKWVPAGSFVALMSDGVSDPKFGTDNALKSPERWSAWWHDDLLKEVNLSRDNAELSCQLQSYLGFKSQGEHDDRTLALVY